MRRNKWQPETTANKCSMRMLMRSADGERYVSGIQERSAGASSGFDYTSQLKVEGDAAHLAFAQGLGFTSQCLVRVCERLQ